MNNLPPLSPAVETYICWLIDNQPEALQVCNIGDLAMMYAEECGMEASPTFVQNFYEACLRFLSRLKKSAEPLKVSKVPNNNLHTNVLVDSLKELHVLEPSQNNPNETLMDHNNLSVRSRRSSGDAQPISRVSWLLVFSLSNFRSVFLILSEIYSAVFFNIRVLCGARCVRLQSITRPQRKFSHRFQWQANKKSKTDRGICLRKANSS
ncbi:unnamed protein product [Dibothriocephalus latus]|uniref:Uncharacterized protein n=1 Tax=Dibothriocephalus latus TaxID=60516 RepID=A0A3P7LJZ9_DIBLA|nr:unnamed protein product [Dibothriocephalus latus]